MTQQYDYDVALSFAGEDRAYVEEVANILHALGIRVFYDRYVEVDLWGKDLYTHLDNVYRKQAKFCVIFISEHYKRKLWTNHERESAQARALQSSDEYILPARFDDTEIPGMRPTTGYIDLRTRTTNEFAYLVLGKLDKVVSEEVNAMLLFLRECYPEGYKIELKGSEVEFDVPDEDYHGTFPVRLLLEMYRLDLLETLFVMVGIVP
ncbi:MAG: TIR domain-containing protein [Anaerolineae bacterium]